MQLNTERSKIEYEKTYANIHDIMPKGEGERKPLYNQKKLNNEL